MRESESRLATVANGLPAIIAYVDVNETYRFANRAYEEWLGIRREDIIGRTKRELWGDETYALAKPEIDKVLGGRVVSYERMGTRNGAACHLHCVYVPHIDEHSQVLGFFSLLMDVSEQKDLEKKLAHMAQHDALTGLPNRVLFEEHLNHCIKSYKRYMHPFALMYLDIDHFKAINDVHGHTLSDKVLQTFATRISHCIRASDIAARLGGDEFVIMLKGLKIPDDAAIVSQKIIAAMQVPFEVEKN